MNTLTAPASMAAPLDGFNVSYTYFGSKTGVGAASANDYETIAPRVDVDEATWRAHGRGALSAWASAWEQATEEDQRAGRADLIEPGRAGFAS